MFRKFGKKSLQICEKNHGFEKNVDFEKFHAFEKMFANMTKLTFKHADKIEKNLWI